MGERPFVSLNVGGHRFDVARDTLQSVPGSKLSQILSDQVSAVLDDNGIVFIDRDSILFAHVLRFLRDADLWIPPADRDLLLQLRGEARFFLLNDMDRLLMEALFRLEAPCDELVAPKEQSPDHMKRKLMEALFRLEAQYDEPDSPMEHLDLQMSSCAYCRHDKYVDDTSPASTMYCEHCSQQEDFSPVSCRSLHFAASEGEPARPEAGLHCEACAGLQDYGDGFLDLADLTLDAAVDVAEEVAHIMETWTGAVMNPFLQKRGYCS